MDIDWVALLSVEELTLALPKVRLFKANSAGDMGRNVGCRESRVCVTGPHILSFLACPARATRNPKGREGGPGAQEVGHLARVSEKLRKEASLQGGVRRVRKEVIF